jgi:DNA-binding NarL/FixJ family response regulator
LRALLKQDPEFDVVGEACDGREGLRAAAALKPDVVLLDISMPGMNGLEAIGEIQRRSPGSKVIVLTIHKTDEYIHESLRAGAHGYVLKDATQDELRTAIHTVLAGKTFLSPDISARVVTRYLGGGGPMAPRATGGLTQRERQVLKLVAEGHNNRFIGEFLSLSVKTVEKHRSNLMRKLGLHNVANLTLFAVENGLLSEPPERDGA